MISKVSTLGLNGLEGYPVETEAGYAPGERLTISVVGLPDAAMKEARERIRLGIWNSGFQLPEAEYTVNIAPADIRKEGFWYDLSMVLALLAATKQIPPLPRGAPFLSGMRHRPNAAAREQRKKRTEAKSEPELSEGNRMRLREESAPKAESENRSIQEGCYYEKGKNCSSRVSDLFYMVIYKRGIRIFPDQTNRDCNRKRRRRDFLFELIADCLWKIQKTGKVTVGFQPGNWIRI